VLQVNENPRTSIERGRYLAEHIAGALFVECPAGDLSLSSANHWVIDEIAEFLTGERPVIEVERILTTILFTDIVGSTAQADLWATSDGGRSSTHMTRRCANNSGGFVGENSIRPGTGL
jgi:hypothetical protein